MGEVECLFQLTYWHDDAYLYTCLVKTASITAPNTTIKKFNGTHEAGKSNKDVKGIYFEGGKVEYLPKGLHEIFPNLVALGAFHCKLKELSNDNFYGLDKLDRINIWRNPFTSLPSDLFMNMKKLTRISLCHNSIKSLSPQLFDCLDMKRLKLFDLFSNSAIDCCFDAADVETISLYELIQQVNIYCSKPKSDFPRDSQYISGILRGYEEIFASGRFSDFVIKVQEREFNVHKMLLAVQSSVLAAMFECDMKERRDGEMEIKEFSAQTVEDFIHFFYTGEVKDEENVMDLLVIADLYDVHVLKSMCEDVLLQKIDQSNAFDVLNLAHLYSSEPLKVGAFAAIKSMFPDVYLADELIDNQEELKKLTKTSRVIVVG